MMLENEEKSRRDWPGMPSTEVENASTSVGSSSLHVHLTGTRGIAGEETDGSSKVLKMTS